jgi:DNA polymerase III psi subunit
MYYIRSLHPGHRDNAMENVVRRAVIAKLTSVTTIALRRLVSLATSILRSAVLIITVDSIIHTQTTTRFWLYVLSNDVKHTS